MIPGPSETAQPAVSALKLLHDKTIADAIHPGAPIFLGQIGAKRSKIGHLRNEVHREGGVFEMLPHNGHYLFAYPVPNNIPNLSFRVGKEVIYLISLVNES